jgi:hypothetical protein
MATKEQIESLLKLVTEIANQPGNEWVGKKMQNQFGNQKSCTSDKQDLSEEIDLIYKDLKRTKFFLKYIDGSNWREGFKFYKKIKSPELKLSLAADYKEMKIAEQEKNLLEFGRRVVLQIESIFNYLIVKMDAYSIIIEADENIFISKKSNGEIFTNLKIGEYSFFEIDGSRKSLSSIKLRSKLLWVKIYFQLANYSFESWNDLTFLRNKSSHAGNLSNDDQIRYKKLHDNLEATLSELFKFYVKIYNQLESKLE